MCTFHCLYMNTVVRGDLFVNQCLELLVLYKHLRHARGAYYVGKNLALLQFEIMSCTSERKCVHSDWQELQSKRKLTTDTHAQTRVRLYVGHSSQCFMYTLDAPTLRSHDHLGTHIVLHIVKWKKKKTPKQMTIAWQCTWLNIWHTDRTSQFIVSDLTFSGTESRKRKVKAWQWLVSDVLQRFLRISCPSVRKFC